MLRLSFRSIRGLLACLMITVIVSNLFYHKAVAQEGSSQISVEYAKKIAVQQMEFSTNRSFSSNKSNVLPLYDMEDNISAYLIEFYNKDGYKDGYIIVNATVSESPIIEFATEGECFLRAAEKMVIDNKSKYAFDLKKEKIYYLGDLTYIMSDGNHFYDITTSDMKLYNKEDVNKISGWIENNNKADTEKINKEWIALEGNTTLAAASPVYVPNYDKPGYFVMSAFPGYNNHCSPTAGLNMMLYYYINYNYMLYYIGGWFPESFKKMHTNMLTDNTNGTLTYYIPIGITSYVTGLGFKCSASIEAQFPNDLAKSNINNGKPVILNFIGHPSYGANHSVLGLGYGYSTTGSLWYCIADGWTSTPQRNIFPSSSLTEVSVTISR